MMTKATQIIEGHANNLLDKAGLLPQDMRALAENRMAECKGCENLTASQACKLCGCYMPAKTKTLSATCPIARWK